MRAVYRNEYKLLHVEDAADELFALDVDPGEMDSLSPDAHLVEINGLVAELESYLELAQQRRPA